MLSNLRGSEWIIILLIVLLLFGAKRLPDTARGLGRSLRIFKAETKGLRDNDDDAEEAPSVHVAPVEQPRSIQNPPVTGTVPTVAQPVQPVQQPAPVQTPVQTSVQTPPQAPNSAGSSGPVER